MKIYLIILTVALSAVQLFAHSGNTLKPSYLDGLVNYYLDIHGALSSDDLSAANQSASDLVKKLNMEPDLNTKKPYIQMKRSAANIKKASDLYGARESFSELSVAVLEMMPHVKPKLGATLYQFHCAMAFDGRGATWLQSDETVANPYYGEQMLRCGSLKPSMLNSQKVASSGCCPSPADASPIESMELLKPASEELITAQSANYPKICVVSGDELIDGEIYDFAYKGKLVRFCCKGCKKDFMEEPEVFMAKLEKLKMGNQGKAEHDHSKHKH